MKISTWRKLRAYWIIGEAIGFYAKHDDVLIPFNLGCTRMVTRRMTKYGWRT